MDYGGYIEIHRTHSGLGCLSVGVVYVLWQSSLYIFIYCPQRIYWDDNDALDEKTVTTHFSFEQTSRRKTEAIPPHNIA